MGFLFVARTQTGAREHIAAPPLADAGRGSIRGLLIEAAVLLVVFDPVARTATSRRAERRSALTDRGGAPPTDS